MYKCLAPSNVEIALGWEDCLPLARAAGFGGIDIDPIEPARGAAYYRDLLARHQLRPGGTALPVDFRASQSEYDQQSKTFAAYVRTAAAIGLTRFYIWIWPFSDSLTPRENRRFHIERLTPLARTAATVRSTWGPILLSPATIPPAPTRSTSSHAAKESPVRSNVPAVPNPFAS